jgi:hypothetical protein
VCSGATREFGNGVVLGTRTVTYVQCVECGSVSLPHPDWLEEAYSSAINSLDVGLLERCAQIANVTTAVLGAEHLRQGRFLDFAGGYGTLTRLMRDRGFDFHHMDPYAQNLFAQGYDGSLDERYDLVTAVEVLEHLTDPREELRPVADVTDLLLVTTQVLPDPAPAPGTWDYFAEDTGQHITFYSVAGLRSLAAALGMQVTTSGRLVHLFHRRPLNVATRLLLRDDRLAYATGAVRSELARRRGLTLADQRRALERLRYDRPRQG